jgi:hypothetical protein
MSQGDVPSLPPTTPKTEAHERLRKAGFEMLFIAAHATPRCELWKNRHGKTVTVDFSDTTFEHVWTESLELALQERETKPKDPFAGYWRTIFSGIDPPEDLGDG